MATAFLNSNTADLAVPWSVAMETDRPWSITEISQHKLCVCVKCSDSPQKHPFPKLTVKQDSVYWSFSQGEILEFYAGFVQHKDCKRVRMYQDKVEVLCSQRL